ncbi:MAG: type II 3-dehydroquinate dehydratase [Clostridia bacterium]|nr:type II 3-dehydroquinate dehydratase [Clostridia bacterium]
MKIYVLNGPNLNMLGVREPEHYGSESYPALVERIKAHCDSLGIEAVIYQSNHEGDLVDKIQEAYFDKASGIVINPGAYTHTSIALLDALKSTRLPSVEVHISNLAEREEFRQISYVSLAATKRIIGHGTDGYIEAVDFLKEYLGN